MNDVRSFRGSVLFDDGRRPHFQTTDGILLDDDPADTYARHILTYNGERLVGCVRVYCPAVDTPPCVTETLLGEHAFVLMLEKLGLQRLDVVEIGRWMVDPDHRSSGWLAAQLAAGSAALANALKYVSETPRDIVLCSVGTIDRQDAMLCRIGLTEMLGVNQVYCSNYEDTVRVFSCSTIDSLSPHFQRLIMKMAIKLNIGRAGRGQRQLDACLQRDPGRANWGGDLARGRDAGAVAPRSPLCGEGRCARSSDIETPAPPRAAPEPLPFLGRNGMLEGREDDRENWSDQLELGEGLTIDRRPFGQHR
jgi:predicted GNAT family N-acyltransferase